MKPLPKHLRPRFRYLAITLEAWPDADLDRAVFGDALVESVRSLFGDVGVAATEPRIVRFSFAHGAGRAVVRVRREAVDRARAGLAALDAIDGAPVAGCVRGISGTVRACEEKYLHGQQQAIGENNVTFEGADRPATVRGTRVDVRVGDAFAGATDLDLT